MKIDGKHLIPGALSLRNTVRILSFDRGNITMHWSGKVFLGLAIILAMLDAYFALVLVAHRAESAERYEAAVGRYETQHAQLLQTRRSVQDRQFQLTRLEDTWGRYWGGIGGGANNRAPRTIGLDAGFAAGLPQPGDDGSNAIVYIFQENGDAGSTFLGEFELVTVEADVSAARKTSPGFGMEISNWPDDRSGAQFRIRQSVPSASRTTFNNLYVQYAQEERKLDFQQRLYRIQQEQFDQSNEILDQRIAELSGDDDPPENAHQDVIDGLVETMRREEVARNAELVELYDLRRQYLRKTNQLQQLIDQNQGYVADLPGAGAAATRPASSTTTPTTVPVSSGN